ncbi:MAG: D-tagatose-bisphosphate aldolase, class II, non-catalytic subunit [Ancalomicrobiaceae bacterium]|nr:D-tagatose-bisphosphate aldolase, class II, non-catalytic subunit [Ancalomicrobiaceae bacterium]
MTDNPLHDISSWRSRPRPLGIPSVCSAHPLVIEAAMRRAARHGLPVLIEATCNQVNQEGGYTGMTPADFRNLVRRIAGEVGFPFAQVILGGDHLGPNPWKHLPAADAMARARSMVRAYAEAGFTKLHLDTSMGCLGEAAALDDAETARRAAGLAAEAEAVAGQAAVAPVYVIGTEVPTPGGAMEAIEALTVTTPEAARETVRVHREAFIAADLADAFGRVVGMVVQPGVEFGNHNVVCYDRGKARALSQALAGLPGMVFEAHSTDYQHPEALRGLVDDGFAILKVGPGLTFALREALYGLDHIAEILFPGRRAATLAATLEAVMLQQPSHWSKYCSGAADEQRLQRHYSYSDRIRYYWPDPKVDAAVAELFRLLDGVSIPETLISAYLHACYDAVRRGTLRPQGRDLVLAMVDAVLVPYFSACLAAPAE